MVHREARAACLDLGRWRRWHVAQRIGPLARPHAADSSGGCGARAEVPASKPGRGALGPAARPQLEIEALWALRTLRARRGRHLRRGRRRGRRQHRGEVHAEGEVQRRPPHGLAEVAAPERCGGGGLAIIPATCQGHAGGVLARLLASGALVKLRAAMALVDLTGVEPIVVMGIDVRREGKERTSVVLDTERVVVVVIRIGLAVLRPGGLLLQRPYLLRHRRVPEPALRPPVEDLVAFVRPRPAVVVVALAPEAPEELRILLQPPRAAEVAVT
mmetsp:Transcript_96026/g.248818  ORF Transcript_96026/g.248818 Transcript_96026/m.248818 type:complete len:273 (+) Transcript_96026:476-1294(+)